MLRGRLGDVPAISTSSLLHLQRLGDLVVVERVALALPFAYHLAFLVHLLRALLDASSNH